MSRLSITTARRRGSAGFEGDLSEGDWLPTASAFDRATFERTWDAVSIFIAAQIESPRPAVAPDEHPPLEPIEAPHPGLSKGTITAETPP